MPVQHRSVCLSISKIQIVWMRQSIIWQVNKFFYLLLFFFVTFIAQILSWCIHEPETYEKNTTFKCIKQFQDPQLSHRNAKNEVVRFVCCTTDSGDIVKIWGHFERSKPTPIILEYNQTGLLPCLDLFGRPSRREIRHSPIYFTGTVNLLILRAMECSLFLCILNIKWKWHLYIHQIIRLKGRRVLRDKGII